MPRKTTWKPKTQKCNFCLRDKIIRDYGYGAVVTPEMIRKRYSRAHSTSYIGVILAKSEKSRKRSASPWVFTWRVGEGRYKIIRPYRRKK
ncbi:MAG: hypothetical protein CO189_10285 [candidate division Zixibacteria bacterium CG_4_9_14_3_um_filter_46_8]|nr:MAG: hypothetical protein CO189_10285 [candidate division Zixibacteria bacterium CG_4_9_14_3_um_filter_46_8]